MSVDWPDYQTPQAHATAISITGAPLLNLSGNLSNTSPTIASSGSASSGTLQLNQPAYEVYVSAQYTAAGANGTPLKLRLLWADLSTGLVLDQEDFQFIPGSSVGPAHIVTVRGLTKSNTLVASLTNNDLASSVSCQLAVWQHSRVVPRDIAKTLAIPSIPAALTFTAAFGRPNSNEVLDYFNASLAGGGTATALASLYSGQVGLFFGNQSNTNALQVAVYDVLDTPGSSAPIYQGQNDSSASSFALINLPRNQCIVKATMTGASAHAVQIKMVATETQS